MSGTERKTITGQIIYECECEMTPEYGIFREERSKEYNIDSCCGGGCVAAFNIKYCPYCGKKIKKK